jgi:hypothetical protein
MSLLPPSSGQWVSRQGFCLDWLVPISQTDSTRAAYSSPWWRRQQGPLNVGKLYQPHGATTQKTAIFKITILYENYSSAAAYRLWPMVFGYLQSADHCLVTNTGPIWLTTNAILSYWWQRSINWTGYTMPNDKLHDYEWDGRGGRKWLTFTDLPGLPAEIRTRWFLDTN